MSYFGTIDKLLDDYNECKNDPYIGIVQCDTPPEKSSSGDSRVLLLDFAPRQNDRRSYSIMNAGMADMASCRYDDRRMRHSSYRHISIAQSIVYINS